VRDDGATGAAAGATEGVPVSAVVVNYNAADHLVGCVASLRSEGIEDVVVVDNGSSDGSIGALRRADPQARIVQPMRNLGYGGGANAGARHAQHELILVCNPDLVLHDGSLEPLVAAALAHPDVAVVGPRILSAEGVVYPSARSFPTLGEAVGHAFVGLVSEDNRWTRRYKRPLEGETTTLETDWVSGACFLVRRDAFSSVGGFDEAYFMYVEDVDLCWRLRRAGWRVLHEPASVVTHVQGVSTARHPYRMALAHHRSMWRFANRSYSGAERLALPVVAAGIAVRLAITCGRAAMERPAELPRRGELAPEGEDKGVAAPD
jgi:N-acetylglucosaminyl-diphospho-decaprenol L-rhamnosyltransferase